MILFQLNLTARKHVIIQNKYKSLNLIEMLAAYFCLIEMLAAYFCLIEMLAAYFCLLSAY